MPLKIAFFGLPLAALLLHRDGHDIVLCAACRTEALGLRRARRVFGDRLVVKPQAGSPALLERLRGARPDLLVSWFWTTRLPMSLVDACPLGGVGVHPSLLPRHRGPDPYFWAIEAGDRETGVSAHRIAEAYDTGAVLGQKRLAIGDQMTAWQLAKALDRPSLSLLREVVSAFARGEAPGEIEQDEALVTEAPAPDDELCALHFASSTEAVLRRIRALSPAPGAYTEIAGQMVTVLRAEAVARYPKALEPAEACVLDGRLVVRTGDGAVALLEGEVDDEHLDASELAALL